MAVDGKSYIADAIYIGNSRVDIGRAAAAVKRVSGRVGNIYSWRGAYYDWRRDVVSYSKVFAGCTAIVGSREGEAICTLLEVADISGKVAVSQAKVAVSLAIYSKSNLAYLADVCHISLNGHAVAIGISGRLDSDSWLLAR